MFVIVYSNVCYVTIMLAFKAMKNKRMYRCTIVDIFLIKYVVSHSLYLSLGYICVDGFVPV